ncbi:phosphohistidine phosphatase SixA [Marinomonas sp. GJ51-6]|uniref:phosphohistidine phosphatase SixA n=1 Tax=Marinomonas sp. GJ51-6 TaxID=2992802 RepID=UPI0029344A28|nr:phosphohistidine phosphatase SixA [Marinomonas sp. GJ51-6]WOD07166.1 phosphohistidine phosphatase SixA [Marinomonas sp. GJ51-6]
MKTLKRLYVLRHGHAVPYSYSQDAQRKLTEKGVAQVISTAEAFVKKAEHLDVVFVSPYLRAQQTAKTFLATLGESVEVKDCPEITPDGRVVNVAAWLGEQDDNAILLVTHQPFAYQLIDYLVDEYLASRSLDGNRDHGCPRRGIVGRRLLPIPLENFSTLTFYWF